MGSGQLLELIAGVSEGKSLHQVWHQGQFPFSVTTGYRWIRRWQRNQAHLRSYLSRTRPPPHGDRISASATTFLHLSQAYPDEHCRITAFQYQHQQDFLT